MSSFFNDYLNIPKIRREKKEHHLQMARVEALPADYAYVFKKIQSHMWMFASGSGYDMMKIHYDLIELFEEGAANGKQVLEVTGEDVAAFCDELLANAQTYTENWRQKLNRDIAKKFNQQSPNGSAAQTGCEAQAKGAAQTGGEAQAKGEAQSGGENQDEGN